MIKRKIGYDYTTKHKILKKFCLLGILYNYIALHKP